MTNWSRVKSLFPHYYNRNLNFKQGRWAASSPKNFWVKGRVISKNITPLVYSPNNLSIEIVGS